MTAQDHYRKLTEFVEQCFGVFQVGGIEALYEPAVDRGQQIAGLGALA